MCQRLSKSRAAFYKRQHQKQEEFLQNNLLKSLVLEYRYSMPRLGGRKLYYLIQEQLQLHNIRMGRDRFFDWLRANDLLVKPKKSFVKTTRSSHRFRVHQNRVKDIRVQRPDQVWVSDITYLRLQKGFCYLALVTDAYSRKIVGYDVSDSLELLGCTRALKMACKQRNHTGTIHHSDRGIQYCSNQYTNLLQKENIAISMAEAGNCYENALAERINGILKDEFNLDRSFKTVHEARELANQAVYTYNNLRPHLALKMKKPADMYVC